MLYKTFLNSLILFIIFFQKSITETLNNTQVNSENNTLTDNRTIVVANANCEYPCLSICSADVFSRFGDSEELQEMYEVEVKSYETNTAEVENLSKYFNHNVSLPCYEPLKYPLLTASNDRWTLYEDGILYVHFDKSYRNQQQYCFDLENIWQGGVYEGTLFVPYICGLINNNNGWDQWKSWVMVFSLPFFLLTILFYCFLPELKNCHGKCFIMYLTNLTLTYALISYANLSTREFIKVECFTIGYMIYFTNVAFLTWISIISYDTYIALTGFSYYALFRIYFTVGLITPILTTLLVWAAEQSSMEDGFKPGIQIGSCAVQTKRWSALLYYYIPHIIVLIFCLMMYIKLIIFFQKHENDVSKYAGKIKTSYKKRFTIFVRLFIFMGVVWFLEILSYITYMIYERDNFFTIILDYFNALHGLFIFLCIICTSKFYRNFMKRFSKKRFVEHELITTTSLDCGLDAD